MARSSSGHPWGSRQCLYLSITLLCCMSAVGSAHMALRRKVSSATARDQHHWQLNDNRGAAPHSPLLREGRGADHFQTWQELNPENDLPQSTTRLGTLWQRLQGREGALMEGCSGGGSKQKGASCGAGLRWRRRLQQETELHSKGKGDNSWRQDPEKREEQTLEDVKAAAASQSDEAVDKMSDAIPESEAPVESPAAGNSSSSAPHEGAPPSVRDAGAVDSTLTAAQQPPKSDEGRQPAAGPPQQSSGNPAAGSEAMQTKNSTASLQEAGSNMQSQGEVKGAPTKESAQKESGGPGDDGSGKASIRGSSREVEVEAGTFDTDGEDATVNGSAAAPKGAPHRKKAAPVATLAIGDEDAWWLRVKTDTAKCGVEDASKATKLEVSQRDSADSCEAECRSGSDRVTADCNAWFYCEDTACVDWQTGEAVSNGQCILMSASVKPQPEPEPLLKDVTKLDDFFSYQAGYIKGDLYLRPPHVIVATAVAGCAPCAEPGSGTACDSWQHADWLNRISVANKQDYARLQGFRFMLIHAKASRAKVKVLEDLLRKTAGMGSMDYLLWIEQQALVVNPAFVFPYKRYTESGKDIVMYGDLAEVQAGDVGYLNPGVLLLRNTNATRAFFRDVRKLSDNHKALNKGLGELKNVDIFQRSRYTYRNAMAYMFKSDPERHLANVLLEDGLCISCFFQGADLESPTMFITHFTGCSYCNEFSLAKDDPNPEAVPFNDEFQHHYRLGRCKFAQALEHASTKEIAAGAGPAGGAVSLQASVLVPGKFNIHGSVSACRHSCSSTQGCNAWIYCWRPGGCDDGQEYQPDWYPFQACELYSLPEKEALGMEGRGPAFSSFSCGFLSGNAPGKRRYRIAPMFVDRFLGPTPAESTEAAVKMVLITAIPADPCQFPTADLINKLSVTNKQDYAHRHSFELHLSSDIIDPNVTAGNWNKETMIRKTLAETKRDDAEWIMWLDIDTVMPDMAVLPRFEAYEGADLVVWGNREKIMEGDMNGGINCGVLLIRNTEWARQFFADVGQYAYMPKKELIGTMRPILEKEVHPLVSGFYDTPFITWLLKTQPKYSSKVFFEDEVGINRHWLEMQWGHEDVDTLVTHYAGCTYCAPPVNKLSPEVIQACSSEFFTAYAYSRCNMGVSHRTLLPGGARNVSNVEPKCAYPVRDLSKLKIRLGE